MTQYRAFPIIPSDKEIPDGLLPVGVGYHDGIEFDTKDEAQAWAARVTNEFEAVSHVEVSPVQTEADGFTPALPVSVHMGVGDRNGVYAQVRIGNVLITVHESLIDEGKVNVEIDQTVDNTPLAVNLNDGLLIEREA